MLLYEYIHIGQAKILSNQGGIRIRDLCLIGCYCTTVRLLPLPAKGLFPTVYCMKVKLWDQGMLGLKVYRNLYFIDKNINDPLALGVYTLLSSYRVWR